MPTAADAEDPADPVAKPGDPPADGDGDGDGDQGPARTLVVDGNNVIGSRPDGWWRDRPGATRRLFARLRALHERTATPVLLVLDVPQPDLPEGHHDGVELRYPRRRGRDAADERILELLDERPGDRFTVVTSDRALADGVRARGVPVEGARTFLQRLDAAGC